MPIASFLVKITILLKAFVAIFRSNKDCKLMITSNQRST